MPLKQKWSTAGMAVNALLVIGAAMCLIPFYWLLRSSLMTDSDIFKFPPDYIPKHFLWRNYIELFSAINFQLYFFNTMMILLPFVIGAVITSSFCGYAFARLNFPYKRIWFALIIATLMLPPAVTLIPTFIMWSKLHGINTFWPLIIPAWFGGGPFNIFLMRQFFMTIPRELDEAAIVEGANYFQVFYKILLPLIRPAMLVVGFFAFVYEWNDFFGPLIFLNDSTKFTLALGLLQLQGSYSAQWNLIMAASAVMVLPPIILFLFGQQYFVRGITLTGIKG